LVVDTITGKSESESVINKLLNVNATVKIISSNLIRAPGVSLLSGSDDERVEFENALKIRP
jgi:hypothetical protein